MLIYLRVEISLARKYPFAARHLFQRLATWSVEKSPAGPYGDTWGGSGLSAVALWRWLQLLDKQSMPNADEVNRALSTADVLRDARLFGGMIESRVVPALPALEEEITEYIAHLAWRLRRPDAIPRLLSFLAVHTSADLDPIEQAIYQSAVERGLATADRLDLFRARRVLSLTVPDAQKDSAARIMRHLWANTGTAREVRAEAGYAWATSQRQNADPLELMRVLTGVIRLAADPSLTERALYARALVEAKLNSPKGNSDFRTDLNALLERFPKGRLAAAALYQLGSDYFFSGDLAKSLQTFQQLRTLDGANDFVDSSYFFPALVLVGRGAEGDLSAADSLLQTYVTKYPTGPFRSRALFWRGRIAEKRGATADARARFGETITVAQFDYYAVRTLGCISSGHGSEPEPRAPSRKRARSSERATAKAMQSRF